MPEPKAKAKFFYFSPVDESTKNNFALISRLNGGDGFYSHEIDKFPHYSISMEFSYSSPNFGNWVLTDHDLKINIIFKRVEILAAFMVAFTTVTVWHCYPYRIVRASKLQGIK
jgi:hypothetical protein